MGLGFNIWVHNLFIDMLKRVMAACAGLGIWGHGPGMTDGSASWWHPLKTIQGILA
jgi:hypothetical protein